jgi:hypothetical protein
VLDDKGTTVNREKRGLAVKKFPENHARVFPPEKTNPDPVEGGHALF